MSSAAKKKCRRYSVEYLEYGFVPAPHDHLLPFCLICKATFSDENMKPCKTKKHLISVHPEKKDKPVEFFQKLRDTFQKRVTLSHMVRERPQRLDKATVTSRIDETAGDIEEPLTCLPNSRSSLQLDGPPYKTMTLCLWLMFFNASQLVEEMLFARRIRTDTKGASIFGEIRGYFEENGITMENIDNGRCCLYGRTVVPSVYTIHCVVHREHIVSKKLGLRLNHSLSLVIQVVNFIKSHALQNHLFRQLCEENGEDFDTLLLHTEVTWLFKGNCLQRRREFSQFSNLKAIAGILKDEDILAYVSHLKQVSEDMKERFCDLLNLDIRSWIFDPFGVQAVEDHPEIQEELIELQNDVIARHAFGQFGRGFLIKHDLQNKLPTLWGKCAFRKVVSLTKSRSRLDAAARGDLRLSRPGWSRTS
ncbi:LOW QUALITY PROTEIN: hypothetical protein M514_25807 [Trichuris suis]|uniref:BED-type domain-containing protein n=1 Tax=Trichuris suis TaxID=68888 RepID=A0A085MXQ1_9BILA|nr:LOW QUALITY PROTEIN: hypothetical protein M514_25807 [Trichuris suis]